MFKYFINSRIKQLQFRLKVAEDNLSKMRNRNNLLRLELYKSWADNRASQKGIRRLVKKLKKLKSTKC